jgi:two-component system nitrate/nitrite response regulator NarL
LQAVARGLAVVDRSFVATLARGIPATGPSEGLTGREREVLALLVEGLSNKAIAQRLEISEHTAKFHVNAIMQKLGVQRRVEAVVRAARLGMIDL